MRFSPRTERAPGLGPTLGVLAIACLLPLRASAQCAACANPNFSSGSNDLGRMMQAGRDDHTPRLRVGLVAGTAQSPDVFVDSRRVDNTEDRTSATKSVTLLAEFETGTGAGLGLVVPWGHIVSRGNGQRFVDSGVSDLELRARQDMGELVGVHGDAWPRLILALGGVAPTGSYSRSSNPADAFRSTSQYASLGRGVWWLMGDADVLANLGSGFGILGGVGGRMALGDADDGFAWGFEWRVRAGAVAALFDDRLQIVATIEQQRRARSSEVLGGERVPSISTGGVWLDLVPAVQVRVIPGVSIDIGGRVPLWRRVEGLQNVESWSVFAGLSWELRLGRESAPPAAPPARPAPKGAPAGPEAPAGGGT